MLEPYLAASSDGVVDGHLSLRRVRISWHPEKAVVSTSGQQACRDLASQAFPLQETLGTNPVILHCSELQCLLLFVFLLASLIPSSRTGHCLIPDSHSRLDSLVFPMTLPQLFLTPTHPILPWSHPRHSPIPGTGMVVRPAFL